MEEIILILDYLIVPLIVWIWYADRRILKLESKQLTHDDLEKLYKKIDEVSDKIDNKANDYVHKSFCDGCKV